MAGGSGTRFGGPKHLATLGGRPVVSWSVDACRSVADHVVLVVPAPPDGSDPVDASAADFGADRVVPGGTSRSASVRAGLAAVPEEADVVVVHDAARPLAPASLFTDVVAAVTPAGGADGAIPVLPVSDTVKRVAGDRVVTTVDRADLVVVQTPQAFRLPVLRRAHASGDEATDDAGLLEAIGATVRTVPGSPSNLKITVPGDLELARALAGSGAPGGAR